MIWNVVGAMLMVFKAALSLTLALVFIFSIPRILRWLQQREEEHRTKDHMSQEWLRKKGKQ